MHQSVNRPHEYDISLSSNMLNPKEAEELLELALHLKKIKNKK